MGSVPWGHDCGEHSVVHRFGNAGQLLIVSGPSLAHLLQIFCMIISQTIVMISLPALTRGSATCMLQDDSMCFNAGDDYTFWFRCVVTQSRSDSILWRKFVAPSNLSHTMGEFACVAAQVGSTHQCRMDLFVVCLT
jgi:hypothetical protein